MAAGGADPDHHRLRLRDRPRLAEQADRADDRIELQQRGLFVRLVLEGVDEQHGSLADELAVERLACRMGQLLVSEVSARMAEPASAAMAE